MTTGRLLTTREMSVVLVLGAGLLVGGLALYVRHNTRELVPAVAPSLPAISTPAGPNEVSRANLVPAGASDSEVRPVPESEDKRRAIVVSAAGAVSRPGAYELDPEARVEDLITAAGGASADADLSDINLAARLIDGSTLVVPFGPTAEVNADKLILRKGGSARLANPAQYTISGWRQGQPSHPEPVPERTTPVQSEVSQESPGLLDLNRATSTELESLPGIGPKLAEAIVAYRAQAPFQTVDDLLQVQGIGPKRLDAIRSQVVVK